MLEHDISHSDIEQIRDLFLRQAAGESAHDIDVIDAVLAHAQPGQPDSVSSWHVRTVSGGGTRCSSTSGQSSKGLGNSNPIYLPSA
jgi:hypothetical protein